MRGRRRFEIEGVVQGVGFRPCVYQVACGLGLTGHVCNDERGVLVELQGETSLLDRFSGGLAAALPPGARIDRLEVTELPVEEVERDFRIVASRSLGGLAMTIVPDRAVCPACLREMADPTDRRYRYPFITCTHCGPRYTIAFELPYDRARTTMASFPLCQACRREYEDPLDRRYHAEPIACPRCGPRVWLVAAPESVVTGDRVVAGDGVVTGERALSGDVAVRRAQELLAEGKIVAVKGIGGFHLAVDATNQAAVERLRARKHRPRKPLAVMVRDLELARQIVTLDADAERLLSEPSAPIVLLPSRPRRGADESAAVASEAQPPPATIAPSVAPGLGDLGVMLPYSPLHHLLLEAGPAALVMTSGNPPAEPITTENEDALARLDADAFLLHDRGIHVANDDSVIRPSALGPLFVRRSRGFVPDVLRVTGLPDRRVLALGAVLKVTVATLRGGQLVVGRHLGDLDNARAEAAFRAEVERMLRFGRLEPDVVCVDAHPDLPSALWAAEAFPAVPRCQVQHHHAHLAAVLVEHGLPADTRAVGILLDGFGYGPDGTIWGGEILRGGYGGFERYGRLTPVPQPGGDRAAVEPGRMATSLLVAAGRADMGHPAFDARVAAICSERAFAPLTSSAGRLFDGVASLLGVAPALQDYEGEAAALLEAAADPACTDAYPLPAVATATMAAELDTRVLVQALLEDQALLPTRAARFHNGLADGFADAVAQTDEELVVLGGGAMVNRLLLGRLVRRLEAQGRRVLWPMKLPPGDGGLSAGQAAIGACASLGPEEHA